MSVNKDELFEMLNNLPEDQLKLVGDYAKKLSEDDGLDMEAFNYVIDNYNETLKGLVER